MLVVILIYIYITIKHNISYKTKRRTCIKITHSLLIIISALFSSFFISILQSQGTDSAAPCCQRADVAPGARGPGSACGPAGHKQPQHLGRNLDIKRSQDKNRKCSRNVIWHKCVHLSILISHLYHIIVYIYTAHPQKNRIQKSLECHPTFNKKAPCLPDVTLRQIGDDYDLQHPNKVSDFWYLGFLLTNPSHAQVIPKPFFLPLPINCPKCMDSSQRPVVFLLQNWSKLGTGGPQSLTNNHPSTAVKQRMERTPPSYFNPNFLNFWVDSVFDFWGCFFSSPRSVRDTLRIQAYLGFSGMSMLSPNFTTSTIVVRKATARATARCFGVKYSCVFFCRWDFLGM